MREMQAILQQKNERGVTEVRMNGLSLPPGPYNNTGLSRIPFTLSRS